MDEGVREVQRALRVARETRAERILLPAEVVADLLFAVAEAIASGRGLGHRPTWPDVHSGRETPNA